MSWSGWYLRNSSISANLRSVIGVVTPFRLLVVLLLEGNAPVTFSVNHRPDSTGFYTLPGTLTNTQREGQLTLTNINRCRASRACYCRSSSISSTPGPRKHCHTYSYPVAVRTDRKTTPKRLGGDRKPHARCMRNTQTPRHADTSPAYARHCRAPKAFVPSHERTSVC